MHGLRRGTEGLIYTLSSDETYYTVSGFSESEVTVIEIPLTYKGIPVTEITASAFSGNTVITSIYIAGSVTAIGSKAFYGCTALESVTIGKRVTSIGGYAFYNCTALTEINYNATVVSDLSSDNRVFYFVGQSGSGITVTIGANVTKIPAYLFYSYNSSSSAPKITSVLFEEDSQCTSIGISAFSYCSSLTSINIPKGVTSIGSYTFYGCTALESVTIGKGVTTIGTCAFRECSSLTSINIPDSVTSIGSATFGGCSSLTSITLPFVGGSGSATSASSSTLFGYIFGTSSYTGLKEVTITGGNILLYGAFYNCNSLTSITISEG